MSDILAENGHKWLGRWRQAYATSGFMTAAGIACLALAASFVINLAAIYYATERVSNSVTDIILSNIPALDVDGYFVYGTFLLAICIIAFLVVYPRRIPFSLLSLSLFWVIRSCFTSLTHIAPFPAETPVSFGPLIAKAFFSGGDLFFSGHVGVPFLFALIFWKNRNVRAIFLGWAVYFVIVVLLGHLHYSIDVAAAFFITYTIYHIALAIFPRSRTIFEMDLPLWRA